MTGVDAQTGDADRGFAAQPLGPRDFIPANESARGNNLVLLLGFKFLIVGVLWLGWHRLLDPTVGSVVARPWLATTITVVVAGFLALLAPYFARQIGQMRAEDKVRKAADASHTVSATRRLSMAAYFVPLFLISALGTLNTVFYFGESRIILTEGIDKTQEAIERAGAQAKQVLATPGFDQKNARVQGFLKAVTDEMLNPRNCGEGPIAKQNIARLQEELPGFRQLSGGGKIDCNAVRPIAKSYEEQVATLLQASPEFRDERVAQSRELLQKIDATVAEQKRELQRAKAGLDTTAIKQAITGNAVSASAPGKVVSASPASTPNNDPMSTRSQIDAAIENGVTALRTIQTDLTAFKGPGAVEGLVNPETLISSRGLGSLAQVIPNLVRRYDKVSTYMYLLAAVLADVLLIFLYTQAFVSKNSKPYEQYQVLQRKLTQWQMDAAKLQGRKQLIEAEIERSSVASAPPARMDSGLDTDTLEDHPDDKDIDDRDDLVTDDNAKAWWENIKPNDMPQLQVVLRGG